MTQPTDATPSSTPPVVTPAAPPTVVAPTPATAPAPTPSPAIPVAVSTPPAAAVHLAAAPTPPSISKPAVAEPQPESDPVPAKIELKPAPLPEPTAAPADETAAAPLVVHKQSLVVTPPPDAAAEQPKPQPAPAKPGPVFSDVVKTPAVGQVNPANSVHAGPVSAVPMASAPVLDLRQASQPKPAAAGVLDLSATPKPTPQAEASAPAAKAEPAPAPVAAAPLPVPILKSAPSVVPSSASPAPAMPVPSFDAVRSTPSPAPQPAGDSPAITRFNRAGTAPAPAPVPAAQKAVAAPSAPAAPVMPPVVATQVQAMQKLATASLPPVATRDDAFKLAMSTSSGPGVKSVAAATLAIAIMGGYIWLNNYNVLAVKAAGQKAGIEANLPGFVPSSYNLAGPVAYGPGSVTLQYKSASTPGDVMISQQKTDWNSASLLQFYVNQKATSYVGVQSQGLTIYLYNDNQATWVNKGIQYVISGNNKLSRDDIVKMAQSL